ncbi:unnamed protein product [Haemonchus placei]|uniref:Uncharacterized protein n=1 Tax=Haemonchus placei TaxID=6290 RepID=A0A0N4WPQ3_HAEPC|nr:unnamed protein product [Haemonchus placei]
MKLLGSIPIVPRGLSSIVVQALKLWDCVKFVRLHMLDGELRPTPQFCDIFRLLMSLKCGVTLRDWCDRMAPRRYNVDERRLVQFGMHHQFLRKLSTYPISTLAPSDVGRSGK